MYGVFQEIYFTITIQIYIKIQTRDWLISLMMTLIKPEYNIIFK